MIITSEREAEAITSMRKAKEKERKEEEQARVKKVIDRAYKDTSKAIAIEKILFQKVFNELLIEYREEEEKRKVISSC